MRSSRTGQIIRLGAYRSDGAAHINSRVNANLQALWLMEKLREEGRGAEAKHDREVLAAWSSWGAVPQVFSSDEKWSALRERVQRRLTPEQWAEARATTPTAFYTNLEVVDATWRTVRALGFTGGRVLEAGCGAGVFMEAAPSTARMTGIELDSLTADIARTLHPLATIRTESFTDTPFKTGTFDAAVGNVPFSEVAPYDALHNPDRKHQLHNYFILKNLHMVRPGGVVAVVTSRYTMDSLRTVSRQAMYDQADLLGAVRLPAGTHRITGGTDVVSDLLVFRKRMADEEPGDGSWVQSTKTPMRGEGVPEQNVARNQWWQDHMGFVLGEETLRMGQFGPEYAVLGDEGGFAQDLADACEEIRERAQSTGRTMSPPPSPPVSAPEVPAPPAAPVARAGDVRRHEGHISREEGAWWVLRGGENTPLEVKSAWDVELRALIRIRDAALAVLNEEMRTSQDTPHLAQARARLNEVYDAYTDRYGPINRVKVTETARLDSAGDPIVTRRYPPVMKPFREDPHAPLVKSLEVYDEGTNMAAKAAILHKRVLVPRTPPTSADSPQDAVAIVMDQAGHIDVDHVARLLGVDQTEARRQLQGVAFDDPGTGRLVPRAEYLSGNVREALRRAEEAAEQDLERYQPNVEALRAVVPKDLTAGEIQVRLGAVWVPDSDVTGFVRETLSNPRVAVHHLGGSKWRIDVPAGAKRTQAAVSTWGTSRMDAYELLEKLMTQQRIVVEDKQVTPEGSEIRVPNPVESEAAQEKAERLQEAFAEWCWRDPERATRLAAAYNDRFNNLVLRDYTEEGQALALPGLAKNFIPHPHQRTAVARMINEPSVGLYHCVGAGKTAEMVMGAMELRRLGMVSKPAFVVPNHMLEQFSREFLQLYPAARVLAAGSEHLRGEKRRQFVAKAATGDWDAVILTQGAFGSIPVSVEAEKAYKAKEIARYRTQMEKAGERGLRTTVKGIEKQVDKIEQHLNKSLDKPRDPGLTFEQTGIDYLLVDELHLYKNRAIASNIQEIATEGSVRAADLDMKIHLLRDKAGERGRVITGATATPIANSMAEAWVMQDYLRPELLHQAGITDFDSWAATFGQNISKIEQKPAGDGFRTKQRFAQFQNVPELLRMWHVAADVKTAKDLNLKVPEQVVNSAGERAPEIVSVPMGGELQAYMRDLGDRADKVSQRLVDPTVDNMLKISGDGRKAAMDLRMVLPDDDQVLMRDPGKIDVAAGRIAGIWREHRAAEYRIDGRDEDSPVHPNRGALQIVFCDLGTPKAEWNAYDELRDRLVADHGMDPQRIRFAHEADSDAKKDRLFAACRNGDVDVLIGSTGKMGVGTNIQNRAIALHHLDCPWRPADVEQREGRILRQGNQNPQVQILRYVTEGSFDGYMWQTVARKAAFIDQVMHGRLDQRVTEDIDDGKGEQFGYAQIAAVGSGNPLLLERAEAETELRKLQNLATAHQRSQTAMRGVIDNSSRELNRLQDERIPRLERALSQRTSTAGEDFVAVVAGRRFTERAAAADAIRKQVVPALQRIPSSMHAEMNVGPVAEVGGHTVTAKVGRTLGEGTMVTLSLQDVPEVGVQAGGDAVLEGHGVVTRMENLVAGGLDKTLTQSRARVTTLQDDIEEARRHLGEPFGKAEQLAQAKDKLAAVDRKIERRVEGAPTGQGQGIPQDVRPAPSAGVDALRRATTVLSQRISTVNRHDPTRDAVKSQGTPLRGGPGMNI